MAEQKNLTIDNIIGIDSPNDFDLSADGTQVAFTYDLGGERQVCVMPLAGGWPRRLTAQRARCSSPRWSPDGTQVAFLREKTLWIAQADGRAERKLLKVEAGISTPRWSPDGTQLAFLARTRGWSQVWVVPAAGGKPRLLTPAARDHEDVWWSPDSHTIATTTLSGTLHNRDLLLVPLDGHEPRTLSVANQTCYDLLTDFAPDGSSVVYLSEIDGWLHLWRYSLEGTNRVQLTSGKHEDGAINVSDAFRPRVSPDGTQIAFVRFREGCYDLMVVPFEGGEARRLGALDGQHGIVGWLPDNSGLVVTFDGPRHPHDLWIITLDGATTQITHSLAAIDGAQLAQPESVSYPGFEGLSIPARLFRPPGASAETPVPAIVVPHGGPSWAFLSRWQPFQSLLVQEGYAVLGMDFRGSTGYGRAFREANFGAWGYSDTSDVVAAADYLRTLSWIDGEHIGVYGGSYGGYMVLCALTMFPDAFQCGVDLFGDSDIAESYRHGDRDGRLDLERQMGTPEQAAELYKRGSPLFSAEHVAAPLLILHGREDMRVVPLMSEKMIEALKIEGKYFESQFYDDEGHGFVKPESRKDSYERILKFLNRWLKEEET